MGAEHNNGCLDEEKILEGYKEVWRKFVQDTANLSPDSEFYLQRRNLMTTSLKGLIPEACIESLVVKPYPEDQWKRPKLDIVLDELVLELLKKYPDHPHLLLWKTDKDYWQDFASEN